MTISFRGGEDEELYREFCEEIGIEYSEIPRNIVEDIARNEGVREEVREWIESDEDSLLQYFRDIADPESLGHGEAFDRIEAGLSYGLDDQVEEGLEMLHRTGYEKADRVEDLIVRIDEDYREITDE